MHVVRALSCSSHMQGLISRFASAVVVRDTYNVDMARANFSIVCHVASVYWAGGTLARGFHQLLALWAGMTGSAYHAAT